MSIAAADIFQVEFAIYHSMTENYDMVFTKCMGKILTCIRLMGYGILYLNSEKEVISACWLIMAT